MNETETLLSKWWMTKSAHDANERAAQARRVKIEAMKKAFAERKAAMAKEVKEWKVRT